MSGRFLLDTNIVIAFLAEDPAVIRHLTEERAIFVPSIALGELYYGTYKSSRVVANLARIDELAESNVVLACDTATAKQYGETKNALRMKGRPIPENDIWIAALAIQHRLTLVSRDKHFTETEGLLIETW